MSDQRPPRRVRITRSTRYGTSRASIPAPNARRGWTPDDDPVADLYEADLRRSQLRWAGGILAVVGIPLFGLPLVFVIVPGLTTAEVVGLPVPWLLLAVVVYPLVWLAGRWFVAGAERTERDHVDELTERDARHP